jgi:Raf kinase inhibitor-like YbhB/YbcL family protein
MALHVLCPSLDANAKVLDPQVVDRSPPLRWRGAPNGTVEFAVVCDEPDAAAARPFVHWVLYGIPGDVDSLREGEADCGTPGRNDWGQERYGGPLPPDPSQAYRVRVFALDQALRLPRGATRGELFEAMRGHVLDDGVLVATFER